MEQDPSNRSQGHEGADARRSEERRVVTTLFCDLVGFTALSERNDAELIDAFLRRYYAVARKAIEAYGGTVEKYIGDAVVAVFGVPALHEDDPERAVRAGLRLIDELDALPGVADQPVEVRVGVNTGEVLVRLDVDPASGEGFLTGDAVNTAARLQSAAPPMAVAVGEATHAATEKLFSFAACHPVALKGKAKPLQAWLASAPLARTGSELRSFASEFVGREEEIGELSGLLDRAIETHHPHLALLVGEPGIGKSRLLSEFARRTDDRPELLTWRQGRCLPFGSNVTFWALSEIVRAQAGVLESDGVARTEARLEAILPDSSQRDRLRERLRPLLGLESEEASREENFAAWRQFLESLAQDGPAVVVVEDLHWADEAMLAFMDDLARSGAEVPLLVLATARPEALDLAGSGAGFVAAAERIALGPLSGEETAELARARLGAKSLPTDLQALILERSGGNPLFAEELVGLLQDRDLLEDRSGKVALRADAQIPLPDSIGALIASRLDLLSSERKALLADAAVVGRSFWAGAVAALGPHEPAEVFEGLHELVAKELVRPERTSSIEGESEFVFVHSLVCDVAYGQLTRADRAAKHARLARWLEGRTAGRTEDLAEVLAFHYGTALEHANAAGLFDLEDELAEPTERYLTMAGGRAAPLDSAAAAAHFARAERVADEAAKPKRRFFLSRRTRRTLKRRAPLLVAAAAVIVVAAAVMLAIYEFRPQTKPSGPVTLTSAQIADQSGPAVVQITARVPRIVGDTIRWKRVTESGVVASKTGLIATSSVPLCRESLGWQPQTVLVQWYGRGGDYRQATGYVYGIDEGVGVAAFKVNPRRMPLSPVRFDSQVVSRAEPNVVLSRIGYGDLAVSPGVLSNVYLTTDASSGQDVVCGMRTTAYLPAGATGGPILDSSGGVIGIVGPIGPSSGNPITGDDVAIASDSVLSDLAAMGPSAWEQQSIMGVGIDTITPKLARALRLPTSHGLLVQFVDPRMPAAAAGMRQGVKVRNVGHKHYLVGGDIIVAVNGTAIASLNTLLSIERKMNAGDTLTVRLLRGRAVHQPGSATSFTYSAKTVKVKIASLNNPS